MLTNELLNQSKLLLVVVSSINEENCLQVLLVDTSIFLSDNEGGFHQVVEQYVISLKKFLELLTVGIEIKKISVQGQFCHTLELQYCQLLIIFRYTKTKMYRKSGLLWPLLNFKACFLIIITYNDILMHNQKLSYFKVPHTDLKKNFLSIIGIQERIKRWPK